MLSVVEYETEFALIGIDPLAMARFMKSDGWTRPLIDRVVDLMTDEDVVAELLEAID